MTMRSSASARGSTLLVSMILLAVLSLIGVAAVSLSGRERVAAGARSGNAMLVECAQAAQAQVFAELARWGPGYLTSARQLDTVTLPDGTVLTAPAHYGTNLGAATPPTVKDVVLTVVQGAGGGPVQETDCTNKACFMSGTSQDPYVVVARCTDKAGRTYEAELSFRLGI